MFFERSGQLAGRPRYRTNQHAGWQTVTWAEMEERVRAIAAALIDAGVEPGHRVALWPAPCRVDGDRALLTLDTEALSGWAAAQGRTLAPEEMATDSAVRELLESEVARVNHELASYESVKYFRILPRDLTTETGELTPSLKVKRKVVAEHYRQEIKEMYA